MPARILVLRHGQSTWNAERRWQGQADPPLSDLGTRQARAAADLLGAFDAVVASDLDRARTTAEIIASVLGVGPVTLDADLRERRAGAWEGHTKDEIDQRWPGDRVAGRRPEGWEDDALVLARAAGALGRVAAGIGDDGTALVVSHGGVLHQLEAAGGLTRTGRIANLAGSWFTVGPGVLRADEVVALVDESLETVPDQL